MNNYESSELQRKHGAEIESLRMELAKMTTLYAQLQIPKTNLTHSFQHAFCLAHKHKQIAVQGNYIKNESQNYEIRWILLGPAVSLQKTTSFRIKVTKLSWIALGLCHKAMLQRRHYSRLNGSGEHGTFVMDSNAWIYASNHFTHNYQKKGFSLAQGDEITLVYNPREATLCLIDHRNWRQCEVSLRMDLTEMFQCVGLSGDSEVQVMEYLP